MKKGNMTVREILNKMEALVFAIGTFNHHLSLPLTRGKRQEYQVRLISKRASLKSYTSQLSEMFKGNIISVRFSVPEPGELFLSNYEATFTNLSKDDVVQLLQYRFGPKVNILEINDTPTLLKKV